MNAKAQSGCARTGRSRSSCTRPNWMLFVCCAKEIAGTNNAAADGTLCRTLLRVTVFILSDMSFSGARSCGECRRSCRCVGLKGVGCKANSHHSRTHPPGRKGPFFPIVQRGSAKTRSPVRIALVRTAISRGCALLLKGEVGAQVLQHSCASIPENADTAGNPAIDGTQEFRSLSSFLTHRSRKVRTASSERSKADRSRRQPVSDRIRSVMADLSLADALNRQFGISGVAQVFPGNGGLPKLAVTTKPASAE